jgi:hypothetical protein
MRRARDLVSDDPTFLERQPEVRAGIYDGRHFAIDGHAEHLCAVDVESAPAPVRQLVEGADVRKVLFDQSSFPIVSF